MATIENVRTARGETFSGKDSCDLAWLIYRRWSRDVAAAACAWRRLFQNSTTDTQFAQLVQTSELNDHGQGAA